MGAGTLVCPAPVFESLRSTGVGGTIIRLDPWHPAEEGFVSPQSVPSSNVRTRVAGTSHPCTRGTPCHSERQEGADVRAPGLAVGDRLRDAGEHEVGRTSGGAARLDVGVEAVADDQRLVGA